MLFGAQVRQGARRSQSRCSQFANKHSNNEKYGHPFRVLKTTHGAPMGVRFAL